MVLIQTRVALKSQMLLYRYSGSVSACFLLQLVYSDNEKMQGVKNDMH